MHDFDQCVFCMLVRMIFFFFKQKTAYEMRISDWSSDVCSSDLRKVLVIDGTADGGDNRKSGGRQFLVVNVAEAGRRITIRPTGRKEIGRASCRERVCQYV